MKTHTRLLALIGLLRTKRHPLTRAQIVDALAPIDGYTGSTEAIRKKLRRDLDQLRELGFAVEFQASSNGYVLSDDSRTTASLELTDAEAALLKEAAALLTPPAMAPFAANLGGTMERLELFAYPSTASTFLVHQPQRDPPALARDVERLCLAVWRRRPVHFQYQRPSDSTPHERTIEPWGLFSRRGRWYVVGRCQDRDARRCFLVSRMASIEVTGLQTAGPAFEPPADIDLALDAEREPWDWVVHPPVDVVLDVHEIAPIVARRLGAERSGNTVRVRVTHLMGLWETLLEWSPRVTPVEPPELVQAWTRHHRAIAARHTP